MIVMTLFNKSSTTHNTYILKDKKNNYTHNKLVINPHLLKKKSSLFIKLDRKNLHAKWFDLKYTEKLQQIFLLHCNEAEDMYKLIYFGYILTFKIYIHVNTHMKMHYFILLSAIKTVFYIINKGPSI